MRRMTARVAVTRTVALAAMLVVTTACGTGPSTGNTAGKQTTLTVSAAASLTETFTDLAHRFEHDNPGVTVSLNFGGSAQLAQQIISGAPVDVFASASQTTMDQVTDAGRASGTPKVFVRNVLTIAVPPGNPAGVTGLADLGRDSLRLAVCLPEVPCGAAAQKLFAAAGVTARPDTLEEDVRGVLTKVELGEVDAGLVYRTDVRAAGSRVQGIDFPEQTRVVNSYPVVAVSKSPIAERFVAFVLSDTGRTVFSRAGFQQP